MACGGGVKKGMSPVPGEQKENFLAELKSDAPLSSEAMKTTYLFDSSWKKRGLSRWSV